MANNKGRGLDLGCLIWETIVKGIILLAVVIWQWDKYGSMTKAYHHWADDSWWFAPIFWISLIIWAGVLGFILLVACGMLYERTKRKCKRTSKKGGEI